MVYQPRLSAELIPIIYRIAKKENRPMTKILDRFVRDSIGRYIAENGDEFLIDKKSHYVSEFSANPGGSKRPC